MYRSSFISLKGVAALLDGFDAIPGNQWLADKGKDTEARYEVLARLLADDRLWVDSASARTTFHVVSRHPTNPSATRMNTGFQPNSLRSTVSRHSISLHQN